MNRKRTYAGSAAALLLLFSACEMVGPESGADAVPDGKAAVHIGIEGAGIPGRTVFPAVALADVTTWELWGMKPPEPEETLLAGSTGHGETVYLETGNWNFTLKGFKGDDLILQGNIRGKEITLEGTNTLSFTVAPVSGGTGTFKITITLPPGHGITEVKVFQDRIETSDTVTPGSNVIVFEKEYATGDYYFSFHLYNDDDLYGVVSELIQVRANLRSEKTYTLALEDLNITYVISYELNDGDFGDGVGVPGYYQSTDAAITLPTPTWIGYEFGGWYENAGFTGSVVTSIPTGSTGNKTFCAKWTLNSYSITYELNEGSNNATNPASYTITSSEIILANATRNGYTFKGWYEDNGFTEPPVTSIPTGSTGDKTFYAKWEAIPYTITYHLNGGNDPGNPGTYNIEDTEITLTDATRDGYTFKGWYDNVSLTGSAVTEIPQGSIGVKNFYAKWEAITYAVVYNTNGGSGTMESSTHTYDIPQYLSVNAFTRTGYTFGGWNTAANGNGTTTYANGERVLNLSSTTDSVTLYAQWLPDVSINIWISTDDDILTSNDDVTISSNAASPIPKFFTATVNTGYTSIQWYVDGQPETGGTDQSITINAAGRDLKSYYLDVIVYKGVIPYSTTIHFTVID
jgi:uncharacterized repeat protein (TIGR02543 family)